MNRDAPPMVQATGLLSEPERLRWKAELAPGWAEIVALVVANAVIFLLYISEGYGVIRWVTPLLLVSILSIANYRMVKLDSNCVWTPIFAARLAAIVWLGMGGLFDVIAPDDIKENFDYLYIVLPEEGAKVALLWMTGTTLLMLTIRLSAEAVSYRPERKPSFLKGREFGTGLIFLAAGLAYSFFVMLPSVLLLFPFVIPSSITNLFWVALAIGFYLLTMVALEGRRVAQVVVIVALLFNIWIGLVAQAKYAILAPLLAICLGYLKVRVTVARLIVCAVIMLGALQLLQPLVTYTRSALALRYGTAEGGTIGERTQFVIDYVNNDKVRESNDYSDFSRLNYVPAASFIIGRYDGGQPSVEIANSGYMLIPRAIWPSKPFTTTGGLEIWYLLGRSSQNQIGTTMFADMYWNFGWAGLLLCLPLGLFFWVSSCISRSVVANDDWIMMPFVAIAYQIGTSLDNSFAVAALVPMAYSIIIFFLLRMVASVTLNLFLRRTDQQQGPTLAALR